MLLVVLGPKESQQGIAAMEAGRGSGTQVCQNGQALRLRQDSPEFATFGVPEIDGTEQLETDHAGW
jgi:hypothetical protein